VYIALVSGSESEGFVLQWQGRYWTSNSVQFLGNKLSFKTRGSKMSVIGSTQAIEEVEGVE
jgi:hypothetical protein